MSGADPETSEGGPRNMKYKPPCAAAIFFWPIFYRPGGGGHAPPPWIHYCMYTAKKAIMYVNFFQLQTHLPHVAAFRTREVKVTLPQIKDQNHPSKAESGRNWDISQPGNVLDIDGELFQITHPEVTFRYIIFILKSL